MLSSTSALFTLLLSSTFPSSVADKFTLSKLVAVCISICGLVSVINSFVSVCDVFHPICNDSYFFKQQIFNPCNNLRISRYHTISK